MKSTASSVGKILWCQFLIMLVVGFFFRENSKLFDNAVRFAAAGFVIFLAFRLKMPLFSSKKIPNGKALLGMILLVFVIKFLTTVFYNLFELLLSFTKLDQGVAILEDSYVTGWAGFFLSVVLAPFIEELLFRGLLLRRLEPFGTAFAVFATAIIFSLQHSVLASAVSAFLAGCLLAIVSMKFGLLWSILLHAFNNYLVFIMVSLSRHDHGVQQIGSDKIVWLSTVVNWVFFVLGFLSFLYFLWLSFHERSRIQQWWLQNKPESGLFRQFFGNRWMLSFTCLNIFSFIVKLLEPIFPSGMFG